MSEPHPVFHCECVSRSPDETFALGSRVGELLHPGAVVALIGDLGAGKTLFTKGLAHGLGVSEYQRVNSPTFVIQQQYEGRLRIYHFDAYRLSGSEELWNLGFDEAVDAGGVVVVEWADRVETAVPGDALTVMIDRLAAERRVGVVTGASGAASLRRIAFRGPELAWRATLETLKICH